MKNMKYCNTIFVPIKRKIINKKKLPLLVSVNSKLVELSSNFTGNSSTISALTSGDNFVLFSSVVPSILVSSFLSGLCNAGEEGRGEDGNLISCGCVGGVFDLVCNSHSKKILNLFLISS